MAGIGFRLQTLLARRSYLASIAAYLSSAVISTGPWLAGVFALLMLSNNKAYLGEADRDLLLATIITAFAASLLVASAPQLIITRYLADRFFIEDQESVAPAGTGVLLLLIPLGLLTLPFILFAPFTLPFRLLASTLFVTLTITWLVASFLAATRAYLRLVLIFVFCYATGLISAWLLGYSFGLMGALAGFTFSQVLCLALMLACVYIEFPSTQVWSLDYASYLLKYWDLALVGLVYAIGSWGDSIFFWLSPHAQVLAGFFRLFHPYDSARFMAALVTVPSSALFLLLLETDFYSHYQRFYHSVLRKGTLDDMLQAREGMLATVHKTLYMLLKAQGLLTLFLCLIARDLAPFVGVEAQWVPLLRIHMIAGTLQFLAFVFLLFLLYIDQRRVALVLVAVFAVSNIGLTALTYLMGEAFYGYGYLLASLIAACTGWFLLIGNLRRLEYLTFAHHL
jgi:uncharacterized membrane protein